MPPENAAPDVGDDTDHSGTDDRALDPAAGVLDRLPDRRVASLYDVAVQYATLDWYQTVSSGEVLFDIDPEHLSLLTPTAKGELYGEPENALVVYVDLTGEEPKFDSDRPVRLETVDESQRYELGHSYPSNKTSSMTDYSLTTHKSAADYHLAGERDDAWGTANVRDRFTRWAHSDAADRVVEEYDGDTTVLEALRALGDDEERLVGLLDHPQFPLDPDDEETEREVFVTVKIKTPETVAHAERNTEADSYRYPGWYPVLNEVMAEQKRDRFESLNVENAAGDGRGYVTGESGRVTGGSTGLLGMYGKQQREHFPNISADGSEAWRTRPLSHATAAALATANSVFESFFARLGNSRRLYVLPYLRGPPSTLEPGTVKRFVDEVFDPLRRNDAGDFESAVDNVFYGRERDNRETGLTDEDTRPADEDTRPADGDTRPADGDTRPADGEIDSTGEGYVTSLFDEQSPLYDAVGVATVFVVSGNPDRVFFEHLETHVYRPREFERERTAIVRSRPFSEGVFADAVTRTGSPLLGTEFRTRAVLFGSDFERTTAPTRSSHAVEDQPKAGDIDDVVTRHLDAFLGGDAIPRPELLDEYVHEVVQRQRERFGDDDEFEVPDMRILEQYVQLRALEEIGAVRPGRRDRGSHGSDHTGAGHPSRQSTRNRTRPTAAHLTPVTDTRDHQTPESRADELKQFVENHAVLSTDEPLQAVFLLGGLVGRISALQRTEGVSSTLTRRYPVDYLTKQSIKEVTKEVLQMNETYIQSLEYTGPSYNARYVDRLPHLMLDSDPSDWTLTQSELQWVYALGIAYGKNDDSDDGDDESASGDSSGTDDSDSGDGDSTTSNQATTTDTTHR